MANQPDDWNQLLRILRDLLSSKNDAPPRRCFAFRLWQWMVQAIRSVVFLAGLGAVLAAVLYVSGIVEWARWNGYI